METWYRESRYLAPAAPRVRALRRGETWEWQSLSEEGAAWVAVVKEVLGEELFPASGLVLRVTVEASGKAWSIPASQRSEARTHAEGIGLERLPLRGPVSDVPEADKEAWVWVVPADHCVYVDPYMRAHLQAGGSAATLPASAYAGWEGATPDERRGSMYTATREMLSRIAQGDILSVYTRVLLQVAGPRLALGEATRGEDGITSLETLDTSADRLLAEEEPGYALLHGAAADLRESIGREVENAMAVLREYPLVGARYRGAPATQKENTIIQKKEEGE